ncbi:hypothetical protein TSOC_004799 [Tetrabaena socialis]|uniref:Uncharacterized protein n=1 Tax=Tetrabaena socialis TaxID=47790 RepID=A0A2J8A801_9CHLO|nr:hypothetical protein TSOC_004799 [Tetrabaena socialis]|eukprot:PNH08647.1 hypothetical protein TSOC_004799 [Tetrabaena socialis]
MQRLLLREGLVLLLVAVVCCQAEDFSTAAVRSGPQLAAALADPRVLLVSVEASILVQDSDWDRYAAALPLQLDRNVTLRGARTVPDLYTLNLNFVKRKVQLGNSMALTFEDLVINRYREMLPAQAPGFDLLAPTYASGPHAFLVIRGGALLNRACFPPAVRIEVAVLPRPEEVAPAYSFRLPSPNASSLPCPGPIGTFCPSGANLTFRIADLYPALLRSSEPLYVRCWAWWSSSFRGGLLTVRSSGTLDTAVYVAGQRVFYSVEAIFGGPTNRQPSAPNTTSLAGGYRQLLALEWHGVKPAARLSVMDGSMDGMLTNATLLVADMFAPAA